jgi:hypothetical protein
VKSPAASARGIFFGRADICDTIDPPARTPSVRPDGASLRRIRKILGNIRNYSEFTHLGEVVRFGLRYQTQWTPRDATRIFGSVPRLLNLAARIGSMGGALDRSDWYYNV